MKEIWTLVFSTLFFTSLLPTQQMRTMRLNADSSMIIMEIGARLNMDNNNTITVGEVLPFPNKQSVDLKTGDIIFGVNGKRIASINAFRSMLESVNVDEEVKLGVKRDDSKFIARFKKAEQKSGDRMMIMSGANTSTKPMDIAANKAFMKIGVLGEVIDGKFHVEDVMPFANDAIKTSLKKGFIITHINGKSFSDDTSLNKLFANIEDGKTIELALSNGSTFSFTKTSIKTVIQTN